MPIPVITQSLRQLPAHYNKNVKPLQRPQDLNGRQPADQNKSHAQIPHQI